MVTGPALPMAMVTIYTAAIATGSRQLAVVPVVLINTPMEMSMLDLDQDPANVDLNPLFCPASRRNAINGQREKISFFPRGLSS